MRVAREFARLQEQTYKEPPLAHVPMRKDSDPSPSPQRLEFLSTYRSLPDPQQMGQEIVSQVLQGLERTFNPPLEGGRFIVRLKTDKDGKSLLQASEVPDPRDWNKIDAALGSSGRLRSSTLGPKVTGIFELVDKESGEVLDTQSVNFGKIPTPIFDRSFIVDGKKRFMLHQWRRRPGVFTRQDEAGDLVTEYNVDPATSSRVQSFKVHLERSSDTPEYKVRYGASKGASAWDLAQLLGATPTDLRRAVGSEMADGILAKQTPVRYERSTRRMYLSVFAANKNVQKEAKELPLNVIEERLRSEFSTSKIDPNIARITLGKPEDRVSKTALLEGFRRLQEVANGAAADDRESIALKKLYSPADLLAEAVGRESTLGKYNQRVSARLRHLSDSQNPINLKQLLQGSFFEDKIKSRLTVSMAQRADSGTNPLESFAQATATTILGEGAIGSESAIPKDAKLLNPGSVAGLDPVHTPESSRAGVILNVPARTAIRKDPRSVTERDTGHSQLVAQVFDPRGGVREVPIDHMVGKVIGSFWSWEKSKGGKFRPKPGSDGLVEGWRDGEIVQVRPEEVSYYLTDSGSLFDTNSSLAPFMSSIAGGRVGYMSKQTVAAVPLVAPEVPLVQTKFSNTTFSNEELLSEEAGAVRAGFDGVVEDVLDDKDGQRTLLLRPKGRKTSVEVKLPRNIMLGGGAPLDSRVRVQKGQAVKKGDLLADSNFTRDGKLALGLNLTTAYLPYDTTTFEDAVRLSESAAKKLTSEHLYLEEAESDTIRLGKKHWRQVSALPLPEKIDDKLDVDGVIKAGTILEPGDLFLVGYQSESLADEEKQKAAARAGLYRKRDRRGLGQYNRYYERKWTSPHAGEVVKVNKIKDRDGHVIGAKIFIKTQEPAEIGDKIYGRHANKATISEIVPDDQMPRTKDGKHVELLYNPAAVTGRINPSQNFETFLAKIADQNGAPEVIENFGHKNNWAYVKERLLQAGIPDGEDLFDPQTGKNLKSIGVGKQYILKAKHQVGHKEAGRGIGHFQESGLASKGADGAQSLGELGVYGLLAQNAREFLRDAQLYKSEDRPEVWDALLRGDRLPSATVPTSFKRFRSYLAAAGINLEHDTTRSSFRLSPQTDEDVVRISQSAGKHNVITDPTRTVKAGDLTPERGGLFDPEVTAGRAGEKWARFELPIKVPNPVYEGAIRDLTGLSKGQYEGIVAGVGGVKTSEGEKFGFEAIDWMLGQVDLKNIEDQARKVAISASRDSDRSSAHRTLRTVQMLRHNKLSPQQAFMRKQIPVLPSNMRDLKVDSFTGDYVIGDVNYLYRSVGLVGKELKEAKAKGLPPKVIAQLEAGLYDSVRELMQTEGSAPLSGADYQGLLGTITGRRPDSAEGREVSDLKSSLLKSTLFTRRQVMSGRTVIGPRDDLAIDEVGLPRSIAVSIFEPKIEAQWRKMNPSWDQSPQGRDKLKRFRSKLARYKNEHEPDSEVDRVLDVIAKDRYVAVKRDPVLHEKGIQGFKILLTNHKTLQMNPLVYAGLGADNDGDTLAIFAPVTEAANQELRDKLTPQNGLFQISNGSLAYGLSHEAILGLNRISRDPTNKPTKTFPSLAAAKAAFISDEIEPNDPIRVGQQETTYGKAVIDSTLPGTLTLGDLEKKGILKGGYGATGLGKGQIKDILTHLAILQPQEFGKAANDLRRLGQRHATLTGATLLMEDFEPILVEERKVAEKVLRQEMQKARRIADPRDQQDAVRGAFDVVLSDLNKQGLDLLKTRMVPKDGSRPNVNAEMTFSGARLTPVQLQQVLLGPGAVLDGKGHVVASPVLKSYSEGLSPTEYWSTLHGARMGTVSKVIEVQQPGYLTKQIVNTAMDQVVTEADCGTSDGLNIDPGQKGADLEGRFLAVDTKAGSKLFSRGTLLSGNDLSLLRQKTQGQIKVRSPLTCEAKSGVCQRCVGALPNGKVLPVGSNFGVLASQALGERSTQLTLSTFHSGGVYVPGDSGGARNLFDEASALLRMPATMGGNKATLAPIHGEVESLGLNKQKGGWDLVLRSSGAKPHTVFLPRSRRAPDGTSPEKYFTPGRKVERGETLTEGLASPKELLEVTKDMDQVRGYLVSRLGKLFGDKGVLQRNVEGVVRAVTNTVEVGDPGETSLLPGQRLSRPEAARIFKKEGRFESRPVLKGVDVAPRELQGDFLAQLNFNNLRRSLVQSAQTGALSHYHSTHPVPALAYAVEFNRRSAVSGSPPDGGRY